MQHASLDKYMYHVPRTTHRSSLITSHAPFTTTAVMVLNEGGDAKSQCLNTVPMLF